jgi:hypothetical protein
MFLWIIQQILISVVFIAVLHYIYIYFKDNLTVPKTKDLVKKPIQQYKKIYSSMVEAQNDKNEKSELKNYIQDLHKKKNQQRKMQEEANSKNEIKQNKEEINNFNSVHTTDPRGQISNFTDMNRQYTNF